MRDLPNAIRRRAGLLAIVALGIASATVMQGGGWAQTAFHAQVRAFAQGTPVIDRWHWETKDKSWQGGHFYSVKAPGLAAALVPWYAVLDAAGAPEAAARAARRARDAGALRWARTSAGPVSEYGFDLRRAATVRGAVERSAPMFWALSLVGSVIPAVLLLLLVRWAGERLAPGAGTAAAVTLGAATLVLPFSTVLFSHVAAAGLGFAAFALLWRERDGPPRVLLVAAAGLLAGLAVTFEYPLALAGVLVGLYALARGGGARALAGRGLAYAGGVAAGVAPVLAYNLWAFGSPLRMSYDGAVAVQGRTGHDVLGLNDGGLFGVQVPDPGVLLELLVANRGLLATTPVVAMGLAGAVLAWRRGWRAEAALLAGLPLAYLVYNSGYWLPFGGGSPGPRFLIPALPYLGAGLALAYRRFPATTLALAIPSAVFMVAATTTSPLLGDRDTGLWADLIAGGTFEHSVLTALGAGNGAVAMLPFFAGLCLAVVLAALATPRLGLHDLPLALGLLACWVVLALLGPELAGDALTPLDGGGGAAALVAVGAGAAIVVLLGLRLTGRARRPEPPALAVGARSPAPARR